MCGFSIPIARDGAESTTGQVSDNSMRGLDGSPTGGILDDVEGGSFNTVRISLDKARAIAGLCRGFNGVRWGCDNYQYGTTGLAFVDTMSFSAGTKKFGTHSIEILATTGDMDVAVVEDAYLGKWTIAGWTKEGGGAWIHYIERSDGAKWQNGTRNDSATIPWTVATSTWTLYDDAANDRYFDDLVWLPFEIDDSWGAEWPQLETFSNLPKVKIWGALFGDDEFEARVSARIQHLGMAGIGGSDVPSAKVVMAVTGGRRTYRA